LHIVTKFLVILAAILAISLSGMTIAYSSNASAVAGANQGLKNQLSAAKTATNEVTARSGAEKESLIQKNSALEDQISTIQSLIASYQTDNSRLTAETSDLKTASALHAAQVDEFTAIAQTYADVNKAQSGEISELRSSTLDMARREIELTDRINELEGRLQVAVETNRSLQEMNVELRDQIDRGGSAASAAAELAEGNLRAPQNFSSSITAVRDDGSGNVLVQIAAGSNDRLREDMKLMVVRGGWLANIILQRVDENESVGRVDFLGRGGVDIRVGDRVLPTL
jgi:chromosome segregation ATPase